MYRYRLKEDINFVIQIYQGLQIKFRFDPT